MFDRVGTLVRGVRVAGMLLVAGAAIASGGAQQFHTVQVTLADTPLKIEQPTHGETPFTVAGPQGAVLGEQNGNFEAWVWPMKVLSHLHITAHLNGYDVPIAMNDHAGTIEVRPDRTVITYSHAAIVLRQIMFAPRETEDGTGAVVLFQVDAVRAGTLTFEFTPEVRRMWPAPNYGVPNAEWVARTAAGGGFYILHSDMPEIAAAVTIPGAEPGILPPYQEKPKTYPLELRVAFDPARDRNLQFPLLMVAANGTVPLGDDQRSQPQAKPGDTGTIAEAHPLNGSTATSTAALQKQLLRLNDAIPALYVSTAQYWKTFLATHLSVTTPDPRFDEAIQWAEVSIDQAQVRYKPAGRAPETGLTAGFFSSGDSARPGFGWFFGRDTLWTMYAIDSYGDFDLARKSFNFLFARQRADGKVMHEFSQAADEVDWQRFPYEYAAADATPLMIMAMEDFVQSSGDRAYLQQHWLQIKQAWQFETTHDADGDGIYDNSQGTGWVEGWPGLPKQEIYLAALDQQASGAMGRLAGMMGDAALSKAASDRAAKISATMQREYAPVAGSNMWAFSWEGAGTPPERTATIYPTVAWWDGHYSLPDSDGMFDRWASSEFSPGWGTRDVGEHEKVYDPISYHQGTIWPLFTGWTAMAEYRAGRPAAGYQHLMENVDLTWKQDLGSVTELLSGKFYQPLGRSSSHQTWSSAMVLTPAIRGLFGITVDAPAHTVFVHPQMPEAWHHATIRNLDLAGTLAELEISVPERCAKLCTPTVRLLNAPAGWKAVRR